MVSRPIYSVLLVLQVFAVTRCRVHHHHHVPDDLKSGLEKFEKFVRKTISCRKLPGVAVSLVRDHNVVFSRGFGHADLESGSKVKDTTKFCIGSLTKGFTTTLLANLLSTKENITWDTSIRDILGANFRLSDDLRTQNVNLRDLLAHKVGTPSYFHALLVGFPENTTREELVRRLQFMPATEHFRSEFHYSNYMYTLAGHVAEALGGKSWETMVTEDLLEPLGMRDTGFVSQSGNLDDIATPYARANGKLVPVNKELIYTVLPSGPAGSIYSTARDMAKWILFHLNGGRSPSSGHRLVSADRLNDTYTSQMIQPFSHKDQVRPTFPVEDVTVSYNMGWVTSVYRGYRKVWHSGGIVTFTSQLWLFPDKNAGLFVIINGPLSARSSTAVKTIALRAADLLLGEEPWLNATTTCTYPLPWQQVEEVSRPAPDKPYQWNVTRNPGDYVGTYGHHGFGNITVALVNSTYLTLFFGRFGEMQIQPETETLFHGKYVGSLWFITNSDYSHCAIDMEFVVSGSHHIDGLLFPVDFTTGNTFFKKGLFFSDVPPSYAIVNADSSCSGGSTSVPMSAVTYLLLLCACFSGHL